MSATARPGVLPRADAHRKQAPDRHVPGEVGTWVFIFGDLFMFSGFILIFFVNRGLHPQLFTRSQPTLNRDLGAVNTIVLLGSSLFVLLAVRAVRAGRRDLAPWLIGAGMCCGAWFLGAKVFEYHHMVLQHHVPTTNDFYLYYYILTGLHAFHVCVGMVALAVLWFLSRKPELSDGQRIFFESGACYWHMVDLLWLFLFPLIYLVH